MWWIGTIREKGVCSTHFESCSLTFSAFFAVIDSSTLSSSIHPNFSQYPGYRTAMP